MGSKNGKVFTSASVDGDRTVNVIECSQRTVVGVFVTGLRHYDDC